ncbi:MULTISPECIES: AAA family ATPase [unclassified Bradyrhizobium]|uniref:AAA family ATPase n=1 Tax=unclassified Bradyrhizobium TaxID=2631580 RepID=UPI0028EDCE94|nr:MULTISPECIES: AAA family ATPase [unclassified Bradyrhizobium]
MIHFYVYRQPKRPRPKKVKYPAVFLFDDNWDDYGYKTLFNASIVFEEGAEEIELGPVKLLEIGDSPIYAPRIDDHFTSLNTNFCSLGQSVRYYRHLRDDLPQKLRREYLRGLRDIVSRPKQRPRFEQAPGFETSLLRNGSARDALNRGGFYIGYPTLELPPPRFMFVMQLPDASTPHELEVDFRPFGSLPHRINLLIGRNGTGKTQLLAHLAQTLYGAGDIDDPKTKLHGTSNVVGDFPDFSKVIAISYSAFDQFPIPKRIPRQRRKSLFDYKYCGLRNASGAIDINELKTMLDVAMDAVEREDRNDILSKLVIRLLGQETGGEFVSSEDYRNEVFQRLSAGQRFIIAVAADVVGFIEERSVILFDEPETHLHPGLLSTMIAILHEILDEFDSFAIIATHSPILLQQVPRRFVRLMKRRGSRTSITLPPLETFGEDLGELTRRALDLAEPEIDFHALIERLLTSGKSADEIRAMFERGLPLPVEIYLDSLTEQRRDAAD